MNFLDWFPSHTRTHIQHFIFKVLLFSLKTLRLAATFNQASLMSACLRISSSVYQFSLLIDVLQITRLYFLTCFNERLPCLWDWACYAGINLKRSEKQPLGDVLGEKKAILLIVFILVSKKELRMPGQRFNVTGLRLYLGYVL